MRTLSLLFASLLGLGLGVTTSACHGHCSHDECNCAGAHCDCADGHCQCPDGSCATAAELGGQWACNVLWRGEEGDVVAGDLLVYEAGEPEQTLDRCQSDAAAADLPAGAIDLTCRCIPLQSAQ